ncbi:hypothetical protein GVAV_000485 [Gurleya vavrai]
MKKYIKKKLKPDRYELRRVNELIDANDNKIELMTRLLENYKKYDIELLKKSHPVYIPVLFKIMDDFLKGEKIYSRKNLQKIRALINCDITGLIITRVAGLFFISLFLKKQFDFEKYHYVITTAYRYSENKNMKQSDANIFIAALYAVAIEEERDIFNI